MSNDSMGVNPPSSPLRLLPVAALSITRLTALPTERQAGDGGSSYRRREAESREKDRRRAEALGAGMGDFESRLLPISSTARVRSRYEIT
jgi:hypothetical protein